VHGLFGPIQKNRCKGLYRRVDVAEIPLIGGDLAGRMEIDLVEQQVELLLGEIHVDEGQSKCMKREVPGSKPRVFPLVRH
jgi:hypothetical protein